MGGGGASSLSVLWRKHVASTAQARGAALVPLQGGGGACRVAPVVALPTLRSHPRCPPRWGLHGACFLRAPSCGPSRTLSPLPPNLAALSSGGGGALSAPPYLHPPPLGGRRCVGGGGKPCCHPFVARMSQAVRKHGAGTRRGTCPSAGGGWHAVWLPSSPFLPCVRTPGAPPAAACTARALYGHGRVVRPAPSRRCLPSLPLCPRGGGGALFAHPYLHPPPLGGRRCVGRGGAPLSCALRSTHVAGTTQAWRRHEARHLSLCRGGGLAVCHPSSPLLPCLRTPGGAEVCVWGGACRRPFVARMSQARRKHDASTG